MIIVKPMPDEFCRGHIGRLRQLNFFNSSAAYLKSISSLYRESHGAARPLEAVASLNNIPVHSYLLLHTLLPITNLIIRADELDPIMTWSSYIVSAHGLSKNHRGGYFCDQCVREDIDFWGYSYWRRSHQILGMRCCEKHNLHPLRYASSIATFDHSPHFWSGDIKIKASIYANQYRESSPIQRYGAACQSLLDNHVAWDIKHVRTQLEKRLKIPEFENLFNKTHRASLSKILLERYPPQFLNGMISSFISNCDDYKYPLIDFFTSKKFNSDTPYLLIFLLLFLYDSIEAPITQWVNLNKITNEGAIPSVISLNSNISFSNS
jgi:hypothetical protein